MPPAEHNLFFPLPPPLLSHPFLFFFFSASQTDDLVLVTGFAHLMLTQTFPMRQEEEKKVFAGVRKGVEEHLRRDPEEINAKLNSVLLKLHDGEAAEAMVFLSMFQPLVHSSCPGNADMVRTVDQALAKAIISTGVNQHQLLPLCEGLVGRFEGQAQLAQLLAKAYALMNPTHARAEFMHRHACELAVRKLNVDTGQARSFRRGWDVPAKQSTNGHEHLGGLATSNDHVIVELSNVYLEGMDGVLYDRDYVYGGLRGYVPNLCNSFSGTEGEATTVVETPVLHFAASGPHGYTSMLVESGARYAMADTWLGLSAGQIKALVIEHPDDPSISRNVAELLGLAPEACLRHRLQPRQRTLYKHMYVVDVATSRFAKTAADERAAMPNCWELHLPPRAALEDLRLLCASTMSQWAGAEDAGPRNLVVYAQRSAAAQRSVVNEELLLDSLRSVCTAHGVELAIETGAGPMREQAARWQRAVAIVGPHGGGLANMLLAPRGTAVFELPLAPRSNRIFEHLAAVCGHLYHAPSDIAAWPNSKYMVTSDAAAALAASVGKALAVVPRAQAESDAE